MAGSAPPLLPGQALHTREVMCRWGASVIAIQEGDRLLAVSLRCLVVSMMHTAVVSSALVS